jgi:PKD repeat protein
VAAVGATPAVGNAPLLVQLSSAGSADLDGAISSYAWNFGNGTNSTNPNPSAIYNTPGTYSVSLTVTDNDGASAVKSTTVVVNPPNVAPVPSFTATPLTGSAPLVVDVNGAGSSDADGSVVSYAWNFGNGQNATGALAQTTYNTAGTYVIRLTVTDNRGTSRNTTLTVVAGTANIRPIAVISALPTSGPAPLLVQLSSAGSSDPDGQITSYAWDFGDGRTASGPQTQVTYSTPGTYTVTLRLTDSRGGTSSATESVTVDPPVVASDRIKLQFVGGVNYTFDGKVQGGNLKVTKDAFGIKSVTGTAPYAGPGNSAASVTVNLNRVLIFNAFLGSIAVSDSTNGINSVSTSLFLTPLTSPSATSARGSGTGTTAGRSYGILFTIDDRS